jgi:hypothetical protein
MTLSRKQAEELDRLLRIRLQYVRKVLDRYVARKPEPKDPLLRHLTDAADALQAACSHLNGIACGTNITKLG